MINKNSARLRRSGRTRARIKKAHAYRLTVHRTSNHIYAQLFSPCNTKVLTSASTLEEGVKKEIKHGGNIKASVLIGTSIAKRVLDLGIKEVVFDRSGYKYHGRIKALADAARKEGLKF